MNIKETIIITILLLLFVIFIIIIFLLLFVRLLEFLISIYERIYNYFNQNNYNEEVNLHINENLNYMSDEYDSSSENSEHIDIIIAGEEKKTKKEKIKGNAGMVNNINDNYL